MIFAEALGWRGTSAEWKTQYASICKDLYVDPTEGLDLDIFEKFVNDHSLGCYCSDEALNVLLYSQLYSADTSQSFPEAVVFSCDGPRPSFGCQVVLEWA